MSNSTLALWLIGTIWTVLSVYQLWGFTASQLAVGLCVLFFTALNHTE